MLVQIKVDYLMKEYKRKALKQFLDEVQRLRVCSALLYSVSSNNVLLTEVSWYQSSVYTVFSVLVRLQSVAPLLFQCPICLHYISRQ